MGEFSKHSDHDLFLLIKEESVTAFTEVYERYWTKLYNAARKRLQSNALCEEIVQDVFLKYWEKKASISFSTGVSNYLFTAVRYAVIDHYRRELLKDSFLKISQSGKHADNSNEEYILLMDLKRVVENTVGSLPIRCRTIYQLSRIENKTNKEIASILNISEKTVEGHLTNALKSLKLTLNDFSVLMLAFLVKYFF